VSFVRGLLTRHAREIVSKYPLLGVVRWVSTLLHQVAQHVAGL
jgi:hypothetical protein